MIYVFLFALGPSVSYDQLRTSLFDFANIGDTNSDISTGTSSGASASSLSGEIKNSWTFLQNAKIDLRCIRYIWLII